MASPVHLAFSVRSATLTCTALSPVALPLLPLPALMPSMVARLPSMLCAPGALYARARETQPPPPGNPATTGLTTPRLNDSATSSYTSSAITNGGPAPKVGHTPPHPAGTQSSQHACCCCCKNSPAATTHPWLSPRTRVKRIRYSWPAPANFLPPIFSGSITRARRPYISWKWWRPAPTGLLTVAWVREQAIVGQRTATR